MLRLILTLAAAASELAWGGEIPLPILSYSFKRSQCLDNRFTPVVDLGKVGQLIPQIEGYSSGCLLSDGTPSSRKLTSQESITGLQTVLGRKDFAIEMWVQPKLNVTSQATIFSIGKDLVSTSYCNNNLVVCLHFSHCPDHRSNYFFPINSFPSSQPLEWEASIQVN